jgi:hypothetical protein
MKDSRFKLESDIISHIYEDNKNTVHFNYRINIDVDNSVTLELFTFNKSTNSVFLLHKTTGRSSVEALREMYDYIFSEKKSMSPYTVIWSKSGGDEHVSYFWENSEDDVRSKFFFDKNPTDYTIRVELMPMS